jgi:hypothetical protein
MRPPARRPVPDLVQRALRNAARHFDPGDDFLTKGLHCSGTRAAPRSIYANFRNLTSNREMPLCFW